MLPADRARRLVAELQAALDSCSERQRQLERSLRVSRRLLRAWEPTKALAPEPCSEPETKGDQPAPACAPSSEDLRELELLTQALEKAVRVRKGMSKTGQKVKKTSPSASIATISGTTASAPPQASSQAGSRTSGVRPTNTVPATDHPEHRPLLVEDTARVRTGARVTKGGPSLRDQHMVPSVPPPATKSFTLKEQGTDLRLPVAFRKAASQNARLWAQLSSTQSNDSADATRAAKTQFLQKMQMASGWSSPRTGAVQWETEARNLRKACVLLRLRMREELSAAPADWIQEYRCLLTLEGLQAIVRQRLHQLQELQAGVTEQLSGPCFVERPAQARARGGADPSWNPELLFYSSAQELQSLATVKLRVAMLDQQIHLEKVLMAELLPLINTQEPRGPPWLALCRAAYGLLCQGGEHFLTVLRDDPAD